MGATVWLIGALLLQPQGAEAAAPAQDPPSKEAPRTEPSAAQRPQQLSPQEEALIRESLDADAVSRDEEADPEPSADWMGQASSALESINPEMSVILHASLAYFSEAPLQTGGHDPRATGFNFQQLELAIGASVDPFFRFDANLVFSSFGVEVEEAYGTTLALPANLQARAGQFLTRFGRLNPTHPHTWAFVDQPLVNGKFFGGEGSRGVGVELSWLAPLPWYVETVASANNADGACCARSFLGGDAIDVDDPADLLYTLALEQFFDLGRSLGLLWGLSTQLGPNGTGKGNRTDIYGTDITLRHRSASRAHSSVTLQLEAMLRRRQVPFDLLTDYGGYAQLVWEIDRQLETGVRYGYVRALADDSLDPDQRGHRHRVSVLGAYRPSHFSRVRLQGTYDRPAWRTRPIWAAFVGLELLVGAHTAHPY